MGLDPAIDVLRQRAWTVMRDYVLAHDRKPALREALGLGHGSGRVLALFRLSSGPPLTLGELAEQLQTDPPHATVIVDALEHGGLAERTPHPSDRRRKVVVLTPAGHDAAAAAWTIVDTPPADFTVMDRGDLQTLTNLLARLADGNPDPADSPPDPAADNDPTTDRAEQPSPETSRAKRPTRPRHQEPS